jgi:hypothetical protein
MNPNGYVYAELLCGAPASNTVQRREPLAERPILIAFYDVGPIQSEVGSDLVPFHQASDSNHIYGESGVRYGSEADLEPTSGQAAQPTAATGQKQTWHAAASQPRKQSFPAFRTHDRPVSRPVPTEQYDLTRPRS